jgi:hypothetical protein
VPVVGPSSTKTERAHRRAWALGFGIGGVVLAGASAATFAWNNHRYDEWRADRLRFDAALANGGAGLSASSQSDQLSTRASAIQRTDDIAVGMAVAACGALITAGVLWLTSGTMAERKR